MDCKISDILIMKYMDGELDEAEARLLNEHIIECEKCRKEFYFYDSMVKEFEVLPEIEAPQNFEMEVMAKIKALDHSYANTPVTEKRLLTAVVAVFTAIIGSGVALYAFRGPILKLASSTVIDVEVYDKLLGMSDFVSEFMMMLRNTATGILSSSSPMTSIFVGVIAIVVVAVVAMHGYNLYRKRR